MRSCFVSFRFPQRHFQVFIESAFPREIIIINTSTTTTTAPESPQLLVVVASVSSVSRVNSTRDSPSSCCLTRPQILLLGCSTMHSMCLMSLANIMHSLFNKLVRATRRNKPSVRASGWAMSCAFVPGVEVAVGRSPRQAMSGHVR